MFCGTFAIKNKEGLSGNLQKKLLKKFKQQCSKVVCTKYWCLLVLLIQIFYLTHCRSIMDNNNTTNALLDPKHIMDQEWKRIFVFVLISIFCCGLIGNALVFVVMCNQRFEKTSTSIYLIVLAISDNSVLFSGPITGVMLMSGVFPKFDIRMTRI